MDALRPKVAPVVIGGIVAVLLFDALGSFASKQFGFSYALLIPGSVLIYGLVAALVARRRDWLLGLFAGALMGLTDVTVGWAVSWIIGPGKPETGLTAMTIVGAVITAFVLSGLAGAIGAWIGARKIRGSGAPAA
jgi:hypothetical protein